LKPAKAFDNLASSSITLPADAESLFVSCRVNGQGLSTIKNNVDAIVVELKLTAKKAGALKLPIITTTVDGLPEAVRIIGLGISNLIGDEANLLISVSGISNKSSLIASLGHIYEVVESSVTKALAATTENAAPEEYALSAYPNPFNPSTQVYFAMKESGPATVRIYNLSGQLVRELLNDYREAGEYTLPWNGRDARGAGAASGVYFVRFVAGDAVKVRKVMLVR
jgi:hypothetical protein